MPVLETFKRIMIDDIQMRLRNLLITTFMLLVPCHIPVEASAPTPLGHEQNKAHNLLRTRALAVCKLVKEVQSNDESYLIFENQRVIRGNESRRYLVFHYPDTTGFLGLRQDDIDALQEGKLYLLVLGKSSLPDLMRWVPLAGQDDEATIEGEMKPYAELDKNLRLDP